MDGAQVDVAEVEIRVKSNAKSVIFEGVVRVVLYGAVTLERLDLDSKAGLPRSKAELPARYRNINN